MNGVPGPQGPVGPPGAVGPQGPAGAGVLGGLITLTVPSNGVREHFETVPTAGVTPGMRVSLSLAAASAENENEPELLDIAAMWARAGTGALECGITFLEPASGPVLLLWSAA